MRRLGVNLDRRKESGDGEGEGRREERMGWEMAV